MEVDRRGGLGDEVVPCILLGLLITQKVFHSQQVALKATRFVSPNAWSSSAFFHHRWFWVTIVFGNCIWKGKSFLSFRSRLRDENGQLTTLFQVICDSFQEICQQFTMPQDQRILISSELHVHIHNILEKELVENVLYRCGCSCGEIVDLLCQFHQPWTEVGEHKSWQWTDAVWGTTSLPLRQPQVQPDLPSQWKKSPENVIWWDIHFWKKQCTVYQ